MIKDDTPSPSNNKSDNDVLDYPVNRDNGNEEDNENEEEEEELEVQLETLV